MYRLFGLHIAKWKLILLGGDVGLYSLAVLIGSFFNPKLSVPWEFVRQHCYSLLLVGITQLTVFYIADLYNYQRDYRRWLGVGHVLTAAGVGTVVVIVIFYFPLGAFIGRAQLILQATTFTALLIIWRWIFSYLALPQRLQRPVLIVGAGASGRELLAALRERPRSGFAAVGFVDDDLQKIGTEVDCLPVLGDSSSLPELVQRHNWNLVVVAVTHEKSQQLINALTKLCWERRQILDMPSFYEFLAGKIPIKHISDFWLFQSGLQNKPYYQHLKRFLDLGLAICGLALLWPLFFLIALVIKLDSRGPVFFWQERLGQDGKPFQMLKFRTMIQNAEENGPQWASYQDPRITRVGRILREWRLDELPQLINILKGDMSIIGPRPEREVFIQQFQEVKPFLRKSYLKPNSSEILIREYRERVPYYSYRLLVKPGLTGWAQVMYSYASSMEETWEKLEYDLYYIKNMGFLLDLAILLKTIRIVLFVPAHRKPDQQQR